MKTMIITTLIVCSLVGCASTNKPVEKSNTTSANPPAKPTVSIPGWYHHTPSSEDTLYSVGTAASQDLQLSLDMAILNAKTNLADRLNSRVKAQTKIYSNQTSSGDSYTNNQHVERAVKNSISDVDVAGYSVTKSETFQNNGTFRTFVMLEYSRDKSANIIMNRIRTGEEVNLRSSMQESFKELDNDKQ